MNTLQHKSYIDALQAEITRHRTVDSLIFGLCTVIIAVQLYSAFIA